MKVTDYLFYLKNTLRSETKFMLIIHVDDSQGDETLQILACAVSIIVTLAITLVLGWSK